MSGKFSNSIKIITDTALKFMSSNQLQPAEKILALAYEECMSHSEEKLVRITFEDVFHKLLDVQCGMKKYIEAIKMTEKYIDQQIKSGEDFTLFLTCTPPQSPLRVDKIPLLYKQMI